MVTGIFVVLTGVVLANNTRFGSTIVLQTLGHDIALAIRQAQVYGIAVKRCDAGVTTICNTLENEFDLGYGMHFTRGTGVYELFADVDGSGMYEPGETVLSTTMRGGYQIGELCLQEAGGAESCGEEEVNIVFRRPEPDACIQAGFDGDGDCLSIYARTRITVLASSGDDVELIVENTGQISVQ